MRADQKIKSTKLLKNLYEFKLKEVLQIICSESHHSIQKECYTNITWFHVWAMIFLSWILINLTFQKSPYAKFYVKFASLHPNDDHEILIWIESESLNTFYTTNALPEKKKCGKKEELHKSVFVEWMYLISSDKIAFSIITTSFGTPRRSWQPRILTSR